ncbi:MAG: hypothetical protein ABWZ99_16385, partial [Ilumatobacteraceae bacterium]
TTRAHAGSWTPGGIGIVEVVGGMVVVGAAVVVGDAVVGAAVVGTAVGVLTIAAAADVGGATVVADGWTVTAGAAAGTREVSARSKAAQPLPATSAPPTRATAHLRFIPITVVPACGE